MALTAEQQSQVDFQKATSAASNRMQAIHIARDILMENDRNKPVGERGVTATDIVTFAQTLEQYVTT